MDYEKLADDSVLQKTVDGLKEKQYDVRVVEGKSEALEAIKSIIPSGSSVVNGHSTTLEQIGFMDYFEKGDHSWNNLHAHITSENDPEKRAALRKQSVVSDYYLGSMHALIENGEFIVASNTASQLPSLLFTSTNVILVVSTKKIVPNFDEAMKRLNEVVIPLEDERMKQAYGSGTHLNKVVIFKGESPFNKRTIHVILVKEDLGY